MTELNDLGLYATLLALLLVVVSLLVAARLYQYVVKLRNEVDTLTAECKSQHNQMSIMSESQREIGRQLVAMEERITQLQQNSLVSSSEQSTKAEIVIARLNEGSSMEQIASETGLDEVEISLLKQIHSARQQKS